MSFIRLRQRSTVLFPQPEGPMKAVILLRSSGTRESRTARKLPYQMFSMSQSITTSWPDRGWVWPFARSLGVLPTWFTERDMAMTSRMLLTARDESSHDVRKQHEHEQDERGRPGHLDL